MTSALVKFCSSFTCEGRKWEKGVMEGEEARSCSPFLQSRTPFAASLPQVKWGCAGLGSMPEKESNS